MGINGHIILCEDYVSFETAKLLREKGFEEVCSANYEDFGKKQCLYMCDKIGAYNIGFKQHDDLANRFNLPKDRYKCAAPTLQMAMKWLRKEYNIHIEPRYFPMPNIYRYVIIRSPATIKNPRYFNSYEEACEAAIKYCLENLIRV